MEPMGQSEKVQLSQVMERHGIEWEQLGTHEEHLSVIDYKKVQHAKEVAVLEETISGKQEEINNLVDKEMSVKNELDGFLSRLVDVQDQLETVESKERFIAQNAAITIMIGVFVVGDKAVDDSKKL
ncbi:hypothetical protein [Desulfosporosinus sp. BICA1-9]|uniref:hypothetical protein n=1 Tax=Desulfosporosinus sp. BICA1-9 TaxID=1531958 RepID=UPI000A881696